MPKLIRNTYAGWVSSNPILALEDTGFERDTGRSKIGDGVTAWNDMNYFNEASGSGGGTAPAQATAFLDNFDTAPAPRYQPIDPNVVSGPLAGWTSVGGLLVPPDSGNYGFSPNAIGSDGDGIVDSTQILKYTVGTGNSEYRIGLLAKYIDAQNMIYTQVHFGASITMTSFEILNGVATAVGGSNSVSAPEGAVRWMKLVVEGATVRLEHHSTTPAITGAPLVGGGSFNARWLGVRGRLGWFTRPNAGNTSWRFDSYSAWMF
jgi:hypothetical protein